MTSIRLHWSKLLCFVDDMKIFSTIASFDDIMLALQADLYRIEEYRQPKKLDFNYGTLEWVFRSHLRKETCNFCHYLYFNESSVTKIIILDLGVSQDSKLVYDS